jgi:PAS domain S-box-containing protein
MVFAVFKFLKTDCKRISNPSPQTTISAGMLVMAHGTTAQLKSSEICDNEERISLAMRGSNDGVWDWNLETNEVYYSPRWKSMLGYNEDELQATIDSWKAHVHPDDRDYVLEKAQDYLEGRSESFEVEMRMIHKDGSIVYVLSRAFLAHAESNEKPNRLVGTHVDITERKKSEQFILETSNILEMIAAGKAACPAPL